MVWYSARFPGLYGVWSLFRFSDSAIPFLHLYLASSLCLIEHVVVPRLQCLCALVCRHCCYNSWTLRPAPCWLLDLPAFRLFSRGRWIGLSRFLVDLFFFSQSSLLSLFSPLCVSLRPKMQAVPPVVCSVFDQVCCFAVVALLRMLFGILSVNVVDSFDIVPESFGPFFWRT